MAFTPLHDRVLVRRVESDEKTAGGLIIPDSAKEKPQEGEVVSVGAGARDDDGDRIAGLLGFAVSLPGSPEVGRVARLRDRERRQEQQYKRKYVSIHGFTIGESAHSCNRASGKHWR